MDSFEQPKRSYIDVHHKYHKYRVETRQGALRYIPYFSNSLNLDVVIVV